MEECESEQIRVLGPFEQFELSKVCYVLSNSGLVEILSLSFLVVFFKAVLFNKGKLMNNNWLMILNTLYKLVVQMVKDSMGKLGTRYVGVVFTLFLFVVTLNVVGMMPYSYTVTSQLTVTLTLAYAMWLGKLKVGVEKHGVKLLGMFVPKGLPFGLVPFFVIIELMGFMMPLISLSVSLFANMMSGHVLLKVLFGFTWAMLLGGGVMMFLELIPLMILLGLLGLETGVGLMQGYVLTLLTCIYMGDMEHGGH